MFNWNKIGQWKNKAGDISSKMKDFAKDLITVETEDEDFNVAFEQIQKQQSQSPPQANTPQKDEQKIELSIIRKPTEVIREQYCKIISTLMNKLIMKHNEQIKQISQIDGADLNQYLINEEQLDQDIKDVVVEGMTKIDEILQYWIKELDTPKEIAKLIGTFFTQIQRQTAYQEKLSQISSKQDLLHLIDKSLNNTVQEINLQKDQLTKLQEQLKSYQQINNDNIQLQKKLVDCQDKISGLNLLLKESQSKIKEQERFAQEWDKIRRDYIEEIKQNYAEIENVKQKLKLKEQELSQNSNEIQKVYDIKLQSEQKDEEIDRLERLLQEWQQENQSLQTGIQSIHIKYEQEKDKNETLSKKYESEIKRIRAEIDKEEILQLKTVKEQVERYKSNNSKLQLSLEELELKYQTLQISFKELQDEKNILSNKIKTEQAQTNVIDKRVISNFLITYLDFNTDYNIKQQILETLSSLLNLSKEEKEKIGFFRINKNQPQQQQQQLKQQQNKDTLKDKFIGFLMNGD